MIADPQLLATLERLSLHARNRVVGRSVGLHRSKRYGSSLDFAEFREYQPGDDFRRVDYMTLARLDQLMVRLYEAEDDVTLRLILDSSASMKFDNKFQRARQVAAALGFIALTRRNRVEVWLQDRRPVRFQGRTSIAHLFSYLQSLEVGEQGSLPAVARQVLDQEKTAGFTILFSDLLEEEWQQALQRFPLRGSEFAVMHVLGKGELEPPQIGDIELVDSETKTRRAVTLTQAVLQSYTQRLDDWTEQVRVTAKKIGASYVLVDSRRELKDILLEDMLRKGLLV